MVSVYLNFIHSFKHKLYHMSTFKKKLLILSAMVGIWSASFATTYTAVASGNWSSSATWGGTAPSLNLSSDQVIIPFGMTVNLDGGLMINGVTASLNVQGTLSSTSDSLELGFGALTGTGTINLQSIRLDTSAVMTFAGSVTVNTLYTSSLAIQAAANFIINQTLIVQGGVFTLTTGGLLSMGSDANVIIAGGTLANSGGTLSLGSSYNVTYMQGSVTGGLELSGGGLNNVTINVGGSSTVTLSNALVVNGTLALSSGMLALNGNTLHIMGNLAGGGSGSIYSTNNSSITVSTTTSPTGSLQFAAGGNVVRNLTVNVGGFNGVVTLGSDLTVDGALTFTSGSLNVQSHGLTISSSGSIHGAGSSSYIITVDSGYLAQQVTAGSVVNTTFDVGTSAQYTPATVQLAAGSASGMVQVGVNSGVLAQGTTGADLSTSQPAVNATWFVHSDITSNLNLTLGVAWSTAMEVNGFVRDTAYISHYTSGAWDNSSSVSATGYGSGMFSLQRSGITSLSPFAVFGKNASTTAIDQVAGDIQMQLYPNPGGQTMYISRTNFKEDVDMDIVDLTGQTVAHYVLSGGTTAVPVADLAAGSYVIRLHNSNMTAVRKFSKI